MNTNNIIHAEDVLLKDSKNILRILNHLELLRGEKIHLLDTAIHLFNKVEKISTIGTKLSQSKNEFGAQLFKGKHLNQKTDQKERLEKQLEEQLKHIKKKLEKIIQHQITALEKNIKKYKREKNIFSKISHQEIVNSYTSFHDKVFSNMSAKQILESESNAIDKTIDTTRKLEELLNTQIEHLEYLREFNKEKVQQLIQEINKEREEIEKIENTIIILSKQYAELKQKFITKENETFHSKYTPAEIQSLGHEALLLLHKQEEKTKFAQEVFQEQRKIRTNINSKSFIAVHKTNHLPKHGILKTITASLGDKIFGKVRKRGSEEKGYVFFRETIHFTINSTVVSHAGGNWDNSNYAILIPFEQIEKQVYAFAVSDTFVVGNVHLRKGSEVILPKEKHQEEAITLQRYKKIIGNEANIILYDPHKEYLDNIIEQRIKHKGYTHFKISKWGNQEYHIKQLFKSGILPTKQVDEELYKPFSSKIGALYAQHTGTIFATMEQDIQTITLFFQDPNSKLLEKDIITSFSNLNAIQHILKKLKQKTNHKEQHKSYNRLQQIVKKLQKQLSTTYKSHHEKHKKWNLEDYKNIYIYKQFVEAENMLKTA